MHRLNDTNNMHRLNDTDNMHRLNETIFFNDQLKLMKRKLYDDSIIKTNEMFAKIKN